LPAAPFDTDEILSAPVTSHARVRYDGNRYSVPWRLVGKPLTLRADAETVTLWYGTHRVARHARCWRRGVEVVLPAHADGLLATKPGAQAQWQVAAVEALGPAARQYLECIRAGTRSLRAELDHLRLQDTPPVAPPPLTLADPRLTVPPVRPNLQRYDALLVETDRAAGPTEVPDGAPDA
jgi:hypothetical protein